MMVFSLRASLAVLLLLAGVQTPLGTTSFPDDEASIVHVLNRIGYGPRPGDVERVRAIGLQPYIEQQLRPESIADGGMAAHLADLQTVRMSSREIADAYARPALEARRERRTKTGTGVGSDPSDSRPPMPNQAERRAHSVLLELGEQKVLRAAYSDRQLEEVLTDFWFNHFNVDARKGPDRFLLTEYEREAIRPHVLGSFRDLLEATTRSPAMLFYLDNWMSAGTDSSPMRFRPQAETRPLAGRRRGLNENYGRELLELHTLGVDGGYTQKDVTEVARSLTGWTIQNPRMGGGFRFEPRLHDDGQKVVLGHVIKAGGGIEDGERVLDILADHPSTARFIAAKLARRLVSDAPPPALVDRAAATFRETRGDLRAVTRTILTSPEFLSPGARRAKVKTPFEFVASALRATNASIEDAGPIVRVLQQLGMPLYQCQPPTGYKDTAEAWVNTGALVNRMNFALQLAANKVPGTTTVASPQASADTGAFVRALLGEEASPSTLATIAKATSGPQAAALTFGSPEFQRR